MNDKPNSGDVPNSGDGDSGKPEDIFSQLFGQMGFTGAGQPGDLNAFLAQIQQAMNQMAAATPAGDAGTGIDWTATQHAARQLTAAQGPDPSMRAADQRDVADAARLAEMWLDEATELPQTVKPAAAYSRAEWVNATMMNWRTVVEPIVAAIADAMAQIMQPGDGNAEIAQMSAMLAPMMRNAAGSLYAMQLAQSIAKLASRVVSSSEIGLQLLPEPQVVMLPTNVRLAGEGLELNDDDVLIYFTVREAARQRLFAGVPWLAPQVLALLEHYAREITIDSDALTSLIQPDSLESLTPEHLNELSEQLQGRLFTPTKTPEQLEILARLETLLALIEGWVDEVSSIAVSKWMASSSAGLLEMVRRRRAAGGPAEEVFRTLVGLDIRPRRVRDAANLWAALTQERGGEARDDVWAHPDMLPTAADLDDPLGFSRGEPAHDDMDDMDRELRKLLDDEGR